MQSEDSKVLSASIHGCSPVPAQQLHLHSALPQYVVLLRTPEHFVVLALDKVVQLYEVARHLVESLQQRADGHVNHLGIKFKDIVEFPAVGRQWLLGRVLHLSLEFLLTTLEGRLAATLLLLVISLLLLLTPVPRVAMRDAQLFILERKIALHSFALDP
jgi:hypothetical protein